MDQIKWKVPADLGDLPADSLVHEIARLLQEIGARKLGITRIVYFNSVHHIVIGYGRIGPPLRLECRQGPGRIRHRRYDFNLAALILQRFNLLMNENAVSRILR